MTIDMRQFYQVFFEETDEHLSSMESLLVALDLTAPDSEDVNAIFRAAHSIKGSSATFGFSDMLAVTHVLETLLDQVRQGEARLTTPMVDACLAAGDVLRNLLAAHKGEQIADSAAAAQVRRRLQALCDGETDAGTAAQDAPNGERIMASAARARCALEVCFVPEVSVAERPERLRNMLDELARLGEVELVDVPDDGAPHTQWQLQITTDVPPDVLYDVVDFLAEPGSVTIGARPAGTAAPLERRASSALFDGAGDDADGGSFGFFNALPPPVGLEAADAVHADAGESPADVSGAFGLFARPATLEPEQAAAKHMPGGKSGARGEESIRVSVDKVDQLINLVGELVITQAMLQQSSSQCDPLMYERMINGLGQLQRNTRDLQESVMSIRMLPISAVFSRFPRVVRDLSATLGKQVELKTRGENTDLDKNLIERIADPLTHLVRNSLDHGIEMPAARRAAGKPECGTISLSAFHQGGSIVIEVADDGAGLDRAKILAKARQRGMAAPDTLSDAEVWQLIFEPGFSTAEQVTEVSGRGVGMDVVSRNIAAMGGRTTVDSVAGQGTRMTVRLPLTLAILDGMSVRVGSETYIVPLNHVSESLQVTPQMVRRIAGAERLIQVRGEYLGVVPLHERFNVPGAMTDWSAGIMVVLEAGGARVALLVDELLGQHQVVIKSLEANFRRVAGISGATILGDGRVAMIIDAPALVAGAARRVPAAA